MADGHNPMTGAHMGGNHHPNGLILRNNTWHNSEHVQDRASKRTITSQITTKLLRADILSFGKEIPGFSHKEVSTHSIWSEFAMELYLAKVYLETIMIMGWWSSSAFLRYILIQISNLSKDISTLMTTNNAFYTMPEIEVVYHTPGQNDTYQQSQSLNRRGWEHTNSSLSLPR